MADGSIARGRRLRSRHAGRTASSASPARRRIAFLVMAGAHRRRPFLLYPVFLMKVLCFALFACAFNLLIGYVGLLSFGHAAYLRHGRLRQRLRRQGLGRDAGTGDPAGGAGRARLLGLPFGWLAIRRSGIYFAMITLALAQMVYFFCLQAPFTGGEDGIQAMPRGMLFGFVDLARPT